jgi:hypothetical protein
VRIDTISLVSKAANRKSFKIFKSATKKDDPDGTIVRDAAPVTKDETGLFRLLKSFFTGEDVTKGTMEDKYRAAEMRDHFNMAIEALRQSLGYTWDSKEQESDVGKIKDALSDFKKITEEILLGTDADIKKFAEEVSKSGRKISASRLAELKAAQAALAKIIEETDIESDSGGDANVVKEDLEKLIKGSVIDAVKPLTERLDSLEKSDKDAAADNGSSDAKNAGSNVEGANIEKKDETIEPDISEIVKNAITEVIMPIGERLEKLEKARGFSNKISGESEVKKDTSVFTGAFIG